MSIMDIFCVDKLKDEIFNLKQELSQKNEQLTKQNIELVTIKCKLEQAEMSLKNFSDIYKVEQPGIIYNFDKLQSLWAKWPLELHSTPPQIDRQIKATSLYYTPLLLSPEEGSGMFRGNYGNYHTTLLKCECDDFKRRLEPCKHMYRLAYELDVFMMDNVESVPDPTKLLSLNDVKSLVKQLTNSQTEIFYEVISNDGFFSELTPNIRKLLEINLVEKSNDYRLILSCLKRDTLYSLLPDDTEVKVPKNIKKGDLIELIVTSYPQALSSVDKFYAYIIPKRELYYLRNQILYHLQRTFN